MFKYVALSVFQSIECWKKYLIPCSYKIKIKKLQKCIEAHKKDFKKTVEKMFANAGNLLSFLQCKPFKIYDQSTNACTS